MIGGLSDRVRGWQHRTQTAAGFTLVETLIVLAVTMALFASAMLIINGRQNQTAFNQSTRALQSQVQQIVSEVGSGYYQNDESFKCKKVGVAMQLTKSATAVGQGTNEGCVFVGKVVQFGIGTDPQKYNVYTIAGLRTITSTGNDLADAKARLVAYGDGDTAATMPDIYTSNTLRYGLTVSTAYIANNPGSVVTVGFTSNLSSLVPDDNSQRVNTVPIGTVAVGTSKNLAVKTINQNLATATPNPANGTNICFNSGGTKQSVLLRIGGADRQGNVSTKVYNKLDCL